MILILSKKDHEASTGKVTDWLEHLNAPYYRLNAETFIEKMTCRNGKVSIPDLPDLKEFTVCWFRRSLENTYLQTLMKGMEGSVDNHLEMLKYLSREVNVLQKQLWNNLAHCRWLSHPSELAPSKLEVLTAARRSGLLVPETLVTTRKEDLKGFLSEYGSLISKCAGETTFFWGEQALFSIKTEKIAPEDLEQFPERFFPTLFQPLIPKAFELRIFFLEKELFPMAIFSQNDPKTSVDFRNYNYDHPNRTIPYQLPERTGNQLKELISSLGMTTGSIDMIVRPDDQLIFLEVNPVGQFGMTSFPCNYHLEKKIATYLLKKYEEG